MIDMIDHSDLRDAELIAEQMRYSPVARLLYH